MYNDKLIQLDNSLKAKEKKEVKKVKEPKVKKQHKHPLDCKSRAPNYFCTCDVCGDQIISSFFNCKKCDYDECNNCIDVSYNLSITKIKKERRV